MGNLNVSPGSRDCNIITYIFPYFIDFSKCHREIAASFIVDVNEKMLNSMLLNTNPLPRPHPKPNFYCFHLKRCCSYLTLILCCYFKT